MPALVRHVAVTNLLSDRRFMIQWLTNPESNIIKYNVYRSENQFSGFFLTGTANPSDTQFIDTVPFTFGVNFYWKVTAVDSLGAESDIFSTIAASGNTIGRFDEEPFKQVTVQKLDLVFNEEMGGVKNGVNAIFTTLFLFRPNTTQVYLNGALQIIDVDYVENASLQSITMLSILPISTDALTVNYVRFIS